jgi:hypothetical protein
MPEITDGRPTDMDSSSPTDIGSDSPADSEKLARELAIKQIERRRAFLMHAAAFAVTSVLLLVIWAVSEYHNAGGWPSHGFSQSSGSPGVWNIWIIYPVVGWGALVAMHAWATYLHKPISESQIRREVERQSRRPR